MRYNLAMPSHHHHTGNTITSMRTAFLINLAFTLLEIVGGLLTNSIAILSDAVHDLGDSFSLGLAWYLEKVSQRRNDQRYTYGYRRFSLLAALLNSGVLLGGSILVLSQAVPRLFAPQSPYAPGMALFAIIGIIANGLAVWRLRGNEQNHNARMIFWHLAEDVLGWVAVLLVSLVLLFIDLPILDPLLSIAITLYVLVNVLRNVRRTVSVFLQAVPENINLPALERRLLSIDQVESVHHTHVWSLDGEHHVLTTHVVVPETFDQLQASCVKAEILAISHELNLSHTTVEIEYGDEGCRMAAD